MESEISITSNPTFNVHRWSQKNFLTVLKTIEYSFINLFFCTSKTLNFLALLLVTTKSTSNNWLQIKVRKIIKLNLAWFGQLKIKEWILHPHSTSTFMGILVYQSGEVSEHSFAIIMKRNTLHLLLHWWCWLCAVAAVECRLTTVAAVSGIADCLTTISRLGTHVSLCRTAPSQLNW